MTVDASIVAKTDAVTTQNAKGSLPTNQNLWRPLGIVPHRGVCQIQPCYHTVLAFPLRQLLVNAETGQVKIGPKPLFRQSDKSKVDHLSAPFVSI